MNTMLYLAVAIILALLATRLAKLIRLPNVTAYLIVGLLIGPSCFNLFTNELLDGFDILTTIALGFIAFSIGGEFKLEHIKKLGSKVIVITLFQSLMALALVDIVLLVFGRFFGCTVPVAIVLGAIATATAPAATLMVVRQYKASGPVTNTLLPVVAMDDAIGLMAFSISISIATIIASGEKPSVVSMLVEPLIEIILSLVIGSAIGFLLALSCRFFKSHINRLSMTVAAVLLGVGLSQLLNLSDLLVCMSIGVLFVNLFDNFKAVLTVTDDWTPPLFLMFFVISGAELDLKVLTTVGVLGVVYLVVRSAGKYFGAALGSAIVKSDTNVRKYLGITLLPQAGVAIGMMQMSSQALPEYSDEIRAVVLAATLVYEIIGPMLTKIALTKAGEIEAPKKNKLPKPEKQ